MSKIITTSIDIGSAIHPLEYEIANIKNNITTLKGNAGPQFKYATEDDLTKAIADISTCQIEMYDVVNVIDELRSRIEYLETCVVELLRPVSSGKTENPNQKSDLEFFTGIVPNEDFLKLSNNIFELI